MKFKVSWSMGADERMPVYFTVVNVVLRLCLKRSVFAVSPDEGIYVSI